MPVPGEVTRVAVLQLHQALLYRPARDPVVTDGSKHLGKQAHHCNLHRALPSSPLRCPTPPLLLEEPVDLDESLGQIHPGHHIAGQVGNQSLPLVDSARRRLYYQHIVGTGLYQVVDGAQ